MRIIHLSTSDFRGSASRGGHALHRHLIDRGIRSRFFARECFHQDSEAIPLSGALSLEKLTQKTCFDENLVHSHASSFTLGYPSAGQLDPRRLADADVIHLHDIAGLFSPHVVHQLTATGKPVVWTLPDMWAFTGGCHQALKCGRFRSGCKECPQLKADRHGLPALLLRKKREFFNAPNLHIVAPSQWLAGLAAESGVFGGASAIHAIPPVAPHGFAPLPKAEAKARLGFDPEAFTLLVLCETTGASERHRKGVEQLFSDCGLFNVFNRLARKNRLRMIVLGGAPEEFKNDYGVIRANPAGDVQKLSLLLSAADLAVLPNFEENGSHAVFEAAACGTPVVAMRAGEAGEAIRDGITGKLVPLWDSRRMAEEISFFALHRSLQEEWQRNCLNLHAQSREEGLKQTLGLYEDLSKAPRVPMPQGVPAGSLELRHELPDLLPIFMETMNSNLSYVVATAREQAAAASVGEKALKQAITTAVDKLSLAEQRLKVQLRAGAGNAKMEGSVISIGKLRNHLTRVLRELPSRGEPEAPFGFDAGASTPSTPATRIAVPKPGSADGLLKWAYEAYFKKRHVGQPGVLEQYPPRPMVLEKFPNPGAAPHKLPSIAIVTPSYMQGRYIGETIRSIIDQNYPKLRYAVQDAASTDETVEILKKHSARITSWVSEPDTGQARAVASGFDKISGDIMAWVNSDDLLMPGALRFVGEYFRKHPEVDALYGHRVIVNENSQEIGRWVLPPHDPEVLRSIDYVPQETLFWRKSLWRRVGGISTHFRFALDWDLLLRFQQAGANIVRVPYYLGCFRVHTLQKTSAQMETIGSEEVNRLRRSTPGALTDPVEIGMLSQKVMRQSAWCEWLLRRGIRR